jgi:hypothetical protein
MKGGKKMKNRRNVIAIFLVLAVVCLAVGYATLTDSLTVDGNISLSNESSNQQFAEKVYFTNAKVATQDATVENDVTAVIGNVTDTEADKNDKLTITVAATEFKTLNQSVVVTVDVTNASNLDADVAIARADANDTGIFDITVEQVVTEGADSTIAAGGTAQFKITIKWVAVSAEAYTEAIEFALTATSV